MNSIQEYLEAGRLLSEKYDSLKRRNLVRQSKLVERYKPILEPLHEISKHTASNQNVIKTSDPYNLIERAGPLAYFALPGAQVDRNFGLKLDQGNTFKIGNTSAVFKDDALILDNQYVYRCTPGLWELLTLETPTNYTGEDLENYESILLRTHVYKRNNEPSNRVKSSAGKKYQNIVRPILVKNKLILEDTSSAKKRKSSGRKSLTENTVADATTGKGIRLKKILTNNPVEYVYWNSLDELLERLYILYGEIKAGNTNPTLVNEIVNIIQEFREL